MTRRASSRSRDVGDDRARLAVADAHPKTIVGQFGGETAVLAMPRLPAGTEEEKAAAAVTAPNVPRHAFLYVYSARKSGPWFAYWGDSPAEPVTWPGMGPYARLHGGL